MDGRACWRMCCGRLTPACAAASALFVVGSKLDGSAALKRPPPAGAWRALPRDDTSPPGAASMRGGGGGGHVGCPLDDEGTDELVAAAAEKSAPSMAGSSNGMTLDLAARLLAARLLRSLLIIAAI